MRLNRPILLLVASAPLALAAVALAADAAVTAAAAVPESRATAIATGVAHLTGLAISPLLVLVALGWTDFAQAGGFSATALPLHASPWLLIPCSIVLALVLLKKCAAPAVPLPVRKLLDAAEYLEAKLSALVAAGVLLPTIVATIGAAAGTAAAPAQTAGLAADWTVYLLVVPAVVVAFGAVWISFHVIDALVVLSPFAVIDMLLVAARATILVVLALAFLASPFLAFVLCAPIIVLSLVFAGWCVRLDLFALCVATDLLLGRSRTARASSEPIRAFLASRGLGAPIRTMGHAEPAEGCTRFRYRPFFLLPQRTIELRADEPALVRGAVWATLRDDRARRSLIALAPRYTPHADAVAARLGARLRDGVLRGSWRGIRDALAAILAGPGDPEQSGARAQ